MARMNIILPAMGEGVIEATINKWLVKAGSDVNEDEPLVEVATDKVDSEIPAPSGGTLVEIKAAEGSVVKVGEIIAVLEDNKEKQPEETQKIEKEVERIRETINSVREEKKEEIWNVFSKIMNKIKQNDFSFNIFYDENMNQYGFYCLEVEYLKDYERKNFLSPGELLDEYYYELDNKNKINQRVASLIKNINTKK